MSDNELILTRELDAPRDLVWKVWTDAGHLARWWGPAGFGLVSADLDLRAGGRYLYSMTPPGASAAVWGVFRYDEVTPSTRLVFRSGFSNPEGGFVPNPMAPVWPLQIRNELTLDQLPGGRTRLTLRGTPFEASPAEVQVFSANRHNVQQGFAGTFAQLEAHLAGCLEDDRALVYQRTFTAPRALVWKAWTTAHQIAPWWGPSGFGNTVHKMEVRPGGQWAYTMHGPDGTDYENLVTYLTVDEPSRLVYDHGDPADPKQFLVTVVFTEVADGTQMDYRMVFPTKEARDHAVEKYGAIEGFRQNMDRFEGWLKKSGLVVTRIFPAPRSLVWKAWTEPQRLVQWWGPEHFTCPKAEVDLRVGGRYLLGMKGPDGAVFYSGGEYLEIVREQKLRYTDAFCDETGAEVPAAALGLPGDWPPQFVTVTFEDLGPRKTLVTVHQEQLPAEWVEMTWAGWATSFDKLDDGLTTPEDVLGWEAAQTDAHASVCRPLRRRIGRVLAGTEVKLYHGAPVWFQNGNPLCGYSLVKDEVQLLFWSGQAFPTAGLKPAGKFQAAEVRFRDPAGLDAVPLEAWLSESLATQWNYRDLPKNQGKLLPLVGLEPH